MNDLNEKCNENKNIVIRIMAIISFVCGLFVFPFIDLDSERLTHVYTLIMLVLGAYVGRRATQDISSRKYSRPVRDRNIPRVTDRTDVR